MEGAPIIRREVHFPGADNIHRDQFTYCRRQRCYIKLQRCLRCVHCDGLAYGAGSEVLCTYERAKRCYRDPWAMISEARIAEVMTRDVICVAQDLSLSEAVRLLVERGISGTPVVDDQSSPIGVVSKTDLVRELFDGRRERPTAGGPPAGEGPAWHSQDTGATVQQIMAPVVFSLGGGDTLPEAASLMVGEAIHRVLVVDPQVGIVGILSSLDVLSWISAACSWQPSRRGFLLPATRTG